MPKIDLKPYSPEFADDNSGLLTHHCNMPDCKERAQHKAPKDRSLSEYYYFCLEHVQEYNKAWNFFAGMSHADVEDHIVRSSLWDRPTWKPEPGNRTNPEDDLQRKAWQTYHNTEKDPKTEKTKEQSFSEQNTPEFEAMAIMDLNPPLDLKKLKAKYKELVKQHHPDVNRSDPDAEEKLKSINMAYTILKLAYRKYEELTEEED